MLTALPAAKPSTMAIIERSSLGIYFSRGRLKWCHVEVRSVAILAEATKVSNWPGAAVARLLPCQLTK